MKTKAKIEQIAMDAIEDLYIKMNGSTPVMYRKTPSFSEIAKAVAAAVHADMAVSGLQEAGISDEALAGAA